jgi:phospholipid-binding lipoprotein MlaA
MQILSNKIQKNVVLILVLLLAWPSYSYADAFMSPDADKNSEYAVNIVESESFEFPENYDPLEETNRKIFSFNNSIDKGILKPVAKGYRSIVPEPGRNAIRNFLHNLETPTVLINDMLQGSSDRAGNTLNRFLINSTVGFFGLSDPATDMGYPRHTEDFAQTLAVYGVPDGPYIVSPFFGPSTPRHITGRIVDFAAHPLTWYMQEQDADARYTYGLTETLVAREELLDVLDEIEVNSTDYYVTIRNLYRQRRIDEINNGVPANEPSEYSIDTARDLNLVF